MRAIKRVGKCPYGQTFLRAVVCFPAFDVASTMKPANICTHCAKTKLCNATAKFFKITDVVEFTGKFQPSKIKKRC